MNFAGTIRLCVVACFIGIAFATGLLDSSPAAAEAVAVSVPASQPWTDTGIDLPADTRVDIAATGRIRIAGSDPGKFPDGTTFEGDTPGVECLGPRWVTENAACWSLIGRVGNGAAFPVGYGTSLTSAEGGRLFLGVNDDVFGDNSGNWTATITLTPLPNEPPNEDAARAYVTNYGSASVSVVDTATRQVIETIPTRRTPRGIVITPDGERVYVAEYEADHVSVIDTASNTVTDGIPGIPRPFWLAIAPDGSRVYAANRLPSQTGSLTVIDTASNTVVATVPLPVNPHGVEVSPTGEHVYITGNEEHLILVLDAETNDIVETVSTGPYDPPFVASNRNGDRLYVSENLGNPRIDGGESRLAVLDAATYEVLATIPVELGAWQTALAPDGTRLYLANHNCCENGNGAVTVIDPRSNEVQVVVPVGPVPNGIAITPDGEHVYVANVGSVTDPSSDTVSVIDGRTNEVVDTIRVGLSPSYIVFQPGAPGGGENSSPIAAAGGPYAVDEGSEVDLAGSAEDPDGDPLTYAWDLDNDGSFETPGQTVTFSAADRDGDDGQIVVLQVCDDSECDTDSAQVEIANVAPTIVAVTNDGPITDGGDSATIAVDAIDPAGDADPLAYQFDCDGNGTFEIGPQAAATATCAYANNGEFVVGVRVTDDDGGEATASTTVELNILRIVTDPPLPGGTVNVPYTAQIEATGGTEPYTWSMIGNPPPGLDINEDTGLIFGTPTTAGTFAFSVQVIDSSQIVATKRFTFSQPPSNGRGGDPYRQPIDIPEPPPDNGGDPTPLPPCTNYTVVGGQLPDGLRLDPQTGVISGTPTNGGEYTFTVECTFITTQTATKEFTITIENPAPAITSLEPSSIRATEPGFDLIVNGTKFVEDSVVFWNGEARPATYDSATRLRAVISATDIAVEGTAQVTVVNPPPTGGVSNSATFTINPANRPPVADAGGPYQVDEGGSVELTGAGSDPDGDTLSSTWDLDDDGTFETAGQTASFSAAERDGPDAQHVTLQVCDPRGECATDGAQVEIANVAPEIAGITNDGPIAEGESASIIISASDPTGASDPLAYAADCDGDGAFETGPQSDATLSCTFDDNGSFEVGVLVTDDDGGEATGSTTIDVANVAPEATFVAPAEAAEDEPFVLALTNPVDPSSADTGAGFAYAFDCGDGYGPFGSETGATCVAPDPGALTVRAKLRDKDGGTTDYVAELTIIGVPPTIESVTNDGPIPEGGTATIAVAATAIGAPNDTLRYAFDCDDDGAFEIGPQPANTAACTFADDGSFLVAVQVIDDAGDVAVGSTTVAVTNVAPVVDAGDDAQVTVGDRFQRDGSFTDPGADEWSATVDYGEGGGPEPLALNAGNTFALDHRFETSGEHTVRVCVTDDDGGEGCANVTVTVNAHPVCVDARPSIAKIWPPNHEMVTIDLLGISDPDGDNLTIQITGIRQDEPIDGTGDGDTGPDAAGVGTATATLRAERAGTGNGRVYHIAFVAADGKGGQCTGEVLVPVSHDENTTAIDGGANYDSTGAEGASGAVNRVASDSGGAGLAAESARAPGKGSKKIKLVVPGVAAESLETINLRAQVDGGKRGQFRVVFEIRSAGGGEWTTLATDRKAPFRQTVDLSEFEPGGFVVRAVARGKGGKRYTSGVQEIVIPGSGADADAGEERGSGGDDENTPPRQDSDEPATDQPEGIETDRDSANEATASATPASEKATSDRVADHDKDRKGKKGNDRKKHDRKQKGDGGRRNR